MRISRRLAACRNWAVRHRSLLREVSRRRRRVACFLQKRIRYFSDQGLLPREARRLVDFRNQGLINLRLRGI